MISDISAMCSVPKPHQPPHLIYFDMLTVLYQNENIKIPEKIISNIYHFFACTCSGTMRFSFNLICNEYGQSDVNHNIIAGRGNHAP